MAAKRDRPHLFVRREPTSRAYTPHTRAVKPKPAPAPADRAQHGQQLRTALQQAQGQADLRRDEAARKGIAVEGATPGLYVQFDSMPGVPLKVESLEDRTGKARIEVVAFREEPVTVDGSQTFVQRATVFVPDGAVKKFVTKFEAYEKTTPPRPRERRHHDTFDRVAALRLATLRALWTDDPAKFPADDESIWWEVWLRRRDDSDAVGRFRMYAENVGIEVGSRQLSFDDRTIILARATPTAMSASIDVLDDLAELRAAHEVSPFEALPPSEQGEWAEELLDRLTRASGDCPAVCLLDTGVTWGHPLLEGSLPPSDAHAVNPEWGTHDHDRHGTAMAGVALIGDLRPALASTEPVRLRHALESVKVLPPTGDNDPDLYGAITAEAVSRAEIARPDRRRAFAMAITAKETDRGQPTSWSAAVDALAAGRSFDQSERGLAYLDDEAAPRLLVVSAGNVRGILDANHLDRSDVELIEDPAQAWNALTVGAYTDKATLMETDWPGGQALAPPGELSPWSRTSVGFSRIWPIKPDIVCEGGNVVRTASGEVDFPADSLEGLSTHWKARGEAVHPGARDQPGNGGGEPTRGVHLGRVSTSVAGDGPRLDRALRVLDVGDAYAPDCHQQEARASRARAPVRLRGASRRARAPQRPGRSDPALRGAHPPVHRRQDEGDPHP